MCEALKQNWNKTIGRRSAEIKQIVSRFISVFSCATGFIFCSWQTSPSHEVVGTALLLLLGKWLRITCGPKWVKLTRISHRYLCEILPKHGTAKPRFCRILLKSGGAAQEVLYLWGRWCWWETIVVFHGWLPVLLGVATVAMLTQLEAVRHGGNTHGALYRLKADSETRCSWRLQVAAPATNDSHALYLNPSWQR